MSRKDANYHRSVVLLVVVDVVVLVVVVLLVRMMQLFHLSHPLSSHLHPIFNLRSPSPPHPAGDLPG